MVKLVLALALILGSAAPAACEPPKQQWRYALLIQIHFPTLKKTTWAGKGTPEIADNTVVPDALNKMGDAGWELVSVIEPPQSDDGSTTQYYLPCDAL
jgi:hypothetical protein